jgi:hypothetical protein
LDEIVQEASLTMAPDDRRGPSGCSALDSRHQVPGSIVLDVGGAMRGTVVGPYEVIAPAGPGVIHARLVGDGCGDEVMLGLVDLVPFEPRLEEDLRQVSDEARRATAPRG